MIQLGATLSGLGWQDEYSAGFLPAVFLSIPEENVAGVDLREGSASTYWESLLALSDCFLHAAVWGLLRPRAFVREFFA